MRIVLLFVLSFYVSIFIVADEPAKVAEPFKVIGETLEKILATDEKEPTETPSLEKLQKAIRFLKDSEKLVADAEPKIRDEYFGTLVDFQLIAASQTEEPEELAAIFREALKTADRFSNEDDRKYLQKAIRDYQLYGFDGEETPQTVDEALKIKNPEKRNLALGTLAQRLSANDPPDFAEAIRAAKAITDLDNGTANRELCYAIISVRQMQAKQAENAEKTLQLIEKHLYKRDEVRRAFAFICEEQGDLTATERYVDEILAEGRKNKSDRNAVGSFFFIYSSCLLQLKTAPLAKRMALDMVDFCNELEKEYQELIAKATDSRFETFIKTTSKSPKSNYAQTMAKVLLHVGDRETALKFLQLAREAIKAHEEACKVLSVYDRAWLIDILSDFGLDDDANKELADTIADINAGGQVSTNGQETKSKVLYRFVEALLLKGRFVDAVRITKTIPDEKERLEAYDRTENFIGLYATLRSEPLAPRRTYFSSPQEVLDIAELLTDEPGEKSLENLRQRIRDHAEKVNSP